MIEESGVDNPQRATDEERHRECRDMALQGNETADLQQQIHRKKCQAECAEGGSEGQYDELGFRPSVFLQRKDGAENIHREWAHHETGQHANRDENIEIRVHYRTLSLKWKSVLILYMNN
jgi:hypothetical protein